MDDCKLSDKKCTPCTGKTPRFTQAEIDERLPLVPEWRYYVNDAGVKIRRDFFFPNSKTATNFIHKIEAISKEENHHAACLHDNCKVEVSLTTHAIRGMSENDFILAAKINAIEMVVV